MSRYVGTDALGYFYGFGDCGIHGGGFECGYGCFIIHMLECADGWMPETRVIG